MRLYRLPKHESIDDLTLVEGETPRPGPGQVLVRMRAASLNFRDLAVATGRYMMSKVPPDLVPLSDGAGEVTEIGAGVTRVKVGDRVTPIFMQSWMGGDMEPADGASALGGAIDGVLAEYAVFDERGLVHIPDHLSFEQAATLPCAAVTAWNALTGLHPIVAGQTVLILGTGGVSIFALQFARAAGARVIATSSSDEKLARVQAMGASDGINYKANPEWQAAVAQVNLRRIQKVVNAKARLNQPSAAQQFSLNAFGDGVQLWRQAGRVWSKSSGDTSEFLLTDSASYDPNGRVGIGKWTELGQPA